MMNIDVFPGQPREPFHQEPLPPWLDEICEALVTAGVFPPEYKPNHVLVNGKNKSKTTGLSAPRHS